MSPMFNEVDTSAFRQKLMQRAEPGSLAELALSRYDTAATQDEGEAERKAEEQLAVREYWAARMEERKGPELTRKLASKFHLDADHPALSGLTWYMDRGKLAALTFTAPPGSVGMASGDPGNANLYADVITGVVIEAAEWGPSAVEPKFNTMHTPTSTERTPLNSLADLGRAIAKASGGVSSSAG